MSSDVESSDTPQPAIWTEKPQRLDQVLVSLGLVETRNQAQRLVMAGLVTVNQQKVDKPSAPVKTGSKVVLAQTQRYVSRGGLKLEAALKAFPMSVDGCVALDMGASTGGFTDCLLQHGAKHVYAVDVGYGQLAWSLRQDERVSVFERTHAKAFVLPEGAEPPTIAVTDVSFISLKKVLPHVVSHLAITPQTAVIALIKPQFEYLDYCQPKGFDGIVRDPEQRQFIVDSLLMDLATLLPGWSCQQVIESPIVGAEGNHESLGLWRPNSN
jgi:23S rRNA (cytidine1920-2'-O)/16S rRNA (cytidine1409-2'-O)-methyltransferase